MTTAKEIISVSLRYVGQLTNFSPEGQEDFSLSLPKLNQYIETLRKLGLTTNSSQIEITSLDQHVSFPAYAIPTLESGTALLIFNLFNLNKQIPAWLREQAAQDENDLWVIDGPTRTSIFPGNLPVGSGNYRQNGTRFYPDCDKNLYACDPDEIISETGSILITEQGESCE